MSDIIENDKFCLEARRKLTLNGITSVDGFSEKALNLTIGKIKLKVFGENIKITSYNKATGLLTADGKFFEFKYFESGKSLIKNIFK